MSRSNMFAQTILRLAVDLSRRGWTTLVAFGLEGLAVVGAHCCFSFPVTEVPTSSQAASTLAWRPITPIVPADPIAAFGPAGEEHSVQYIRVDKLYSQAMGSGAGGVFRNCGLLARSSCARISGWRPGRHGGARTGPLGSKSGSK